LSTTKQKDERSGLPENKVPENWSEQEEFIAAEKDDEGMALEICMGAKPFLKAFHGLSGHGFLNFPRWGKCSCFKYACMSDLEKGSAKV